MGEWAHGGPGHRGVNETDGESATSRDPFEGVGGSDSLLLIRRGGIDPSPSLFLDFPEAQKYPWPPGF